MKKQIFLVTLFIASQVTLLATKATHSVKECRAQVLQETDVWTSEEMEVVNEFGLRIDDNRGISLISPILNNDIQTPDLLVGNVNEALIYFMTTGFKKDLIYVRVADISDLPVEFRQVLDIHDVVRLYLILQNK